jgi:hypothetical protein
VLKTNFKITDSGSVPRENLFALEELTHHHSFTKYMKGATTKVL